MPTANWKRLGELLVRRRIELDPRYSNRRLFADESGLNYRIVSDVERGRRDNYENQTIAAVEVAYRVLPGSVARVVAGGEPALQPVPAPAGAPPPDARPDVPSEAEFGRLLSLYGDDPVVQKIADQHGGVKKTPVIVAEIYEWLDFKYPDPQARNGTAGLVALNLPFRFPEPSRNFFARLTTWPQLHPPCPNHPGVIA